jgi:hypothetical protein
MNEKLLKIAEEIRGIITEKQEEMELTFVEDTHTYYIKGKDGALTTGFPSVSTVIGQFYTPFPDQEKSFEMVQGDLLEQDELLTQWRATADYANNQGSRVHYLLEHNLLELYGSYKEVRMPIFDCNEQQTEDGDRMIKSGMDFIQMMHDRGAVLLDTEMVLGSVELGYTGQPDKVWLMFDKQGNLGIVVTDWKTNKPKNFEVHHYTKDMLHPFGDYKDTALAHYMIQLPLYARLLLDMLKGTKYGDIKFLGCVIVHLEVDGQMTEYRVPKKFTDVVLTMDPLPRIEHVKEYKKLQEYKEESRLRKLDLMIHGYDGD